MENITAVTKLYNLALYNLILNCPILSGNMQSQIYTENWSQNEVEIVVSGPSYDQALWQKTGQIVLTGKYNYAKWVNEKKKHRNWVQNVLVSTIDIFATEIDAEVIIDL